MPPVPRRPASSERARPDEMDPPPVEATGGVTASWGADGLVIRDESRKPVWAKITGQASGTNRYSWAQLDDGDTSGTFGLNLSEGFAAAGGSGEAANPAYELTGNKFVATGTKVQLWPAGDDSFWVFTATGAAKPTTPSENSVPAFTSTGDLQNTPQYVVQGTDTVTQYVVPNVGDDPATSPIRLYTVENVGTPSVTVGTYTNGTGGLNGITDTTAPTLHVVTNTFNGATDYDGVKESGGAVQHVIGNSGLTQGQILTPTISGGNVTQFVVGYTIYDGGSAVAKSIPITASGGVITATVPSGFNYVFNGTVTFGSTVTGVPATAITGVLPTANGGTAVSSYTATPLVLSGSGTSAAFAQLVHGTTSQFLKGGGIGVEPAWASIASTDVSGLGTGDSPQFAGINLGHASDTTLTRVSAGVIAVEGVTVLTTATGQPLDGDLTALAALSGTNTIYYRSAADTWSAVTIGSGLSFAAGTLSATSGGGDALTTNPLSQFAATTSLQLKGVISDETGSGALVFADTPTLIAPLLGTPTSGVLTNCTGLPNASVVGLGTAALKNTGTSGNTVPLLDGANTFSALQTITVTDAVTATSSDVLVLDHESSGTPATLFGADVHFKLESSTTASQYAGTVGVAWEDATHATRKAAMSLGVFDTAVRVGLTLGTTGAAPKIGFLGTANAAKQSGDAGTALVTFGLMSGTPTFAVANLSGAGTGVLTFLATPSSANLRAALTDEVGTGAAYFVGGALGTPASGTLSGCDAFVAAGGSAAKGVVPAPGATSHPNQPYYLTDGSAWAKRTGIMFAESSVTTSQTTTASGTAADLTTTQHLSFTLDEASDVLVSATCVTSNTTAGASNRLTADVDGSDTIFARFRCDVASGLYSMSGTFKIAALAAGAHTIKLQFDTSTGTATFENRTIMLFRGTT